MKNKQLFTLFSITVIFVFITSLVSTVNVLADDSTPPASTEEPVSTEEPAATEEPVSTEESVATEVPATEAESAPTPEVDTPAEVLESAPEGVDVVVLDENGEALSLTTEEAAQIIMNGDPMWCIDDVTPNTAAPGECTDSYSDFATLIANLGSYSGNGTIYVAWDYDYTLDGDVVFDHTDANLDELDDLTIQGGWNFTDDAIDTLQDYSNLGSNSLTIANWVGNVTVNNIFISGADPTNLANAALSIDTDGEVELNEVTVYSTVEGMGIYVETDQNVTAEHVTATDNDLHGMLIYGADDVTITLSDFTNNGDYGFSGSDFFFGGDGLYIAALGLVTLNDVTAESNARHGANIGGASVEINGGQFDGNGWEGEGNMNDFSDVDLIDFSVEYYSGSGIYIETEDDITINDIWAEYNAGHGANLFSNNGNITVSDSYFTFNGGQGTISMEEYIFDDGSVLDANFNLDYEAGSGLMAETNNGNITLEGVEANDNAGDGAVLNTENGSIQITDSGFIDNGWSSGFFDDDDGYDFLEEYLVDEFCDDLPVSYYGTIFNPCEDNDYIEVQGSNFHYDVNLYADEDGFQNEYSIEQSGGIGLEAEAEGGTVTLQDVDVYYNGGYGAYIYAEDGAVVTNSFFEENGYIGDFELRACASGGLQSADEFGDCVYNDDQPVDFGYRASFGYEYGDGLHIDAEGNVTLSQVYAYYNANSGALVHADDNGASVLIQDSEFSDNASPIYIGGEGGLFGEFLCTGLEPMFSLCSGFMIPASEFYLDVARHDEEESDDGGFGFSVGFYSGDGLQAEADSNLTLIGVSAEENAGNGAELYSDDGGISVSGGDFSDNGFGTNGYLGFGIQSDDGYESESYESYMSNGNGLDMGADGNITLTGVTANDNAMYGAEIYSDSSVFVEESEFSGNGWYGYGYYEYDYTSGHYDEDLGMFVVDYEDEYDDEWYSSGLYIESDGDVTLTKVVANNNYYDGAEVYSDGGRVIVSCGQYNENGEYGIYEEDASSLELYGPEILGNGNSPDEYFFSGSLILSDDCLQGEGEGGDEVKKNTTGGFDVCVGPAESATFKTPKGDFATFPCPINDQASVQPLGEDKLPGELEDGQKFLSALVTNVIRDNKPVDELENAALISFIIPEGVDQTSLAILFWDGTQWTELGGELSADGLRFEVSTKLVGTFVLVSK